VTLSESPAENIIVAGEFGQDAALVMVMLISGRTEEQKVALIAAINRAVHESIGISDQNVRVIVRDVPNTDMGMAGGVTAKSAGR
jgi:4-oxalocrotonate tautomerase